VTGAGGRRFTGVLRLVAVARRFVPAPLRHHLRRLAIQWVDFCWALPTGIRFRIEDGEDWILYNEIFASGVYDEAIELALNTSDSDRPLVALDLGANGGFATLRIAHLARRRNRPVRIVAIDAGEDILARLRTRVQDSNLSDQVRIVCGAVGARSGVATLNDTGSHSTRTLTPTPDARRAVRTRFVDLDELLADVPVIDVLKADIEGAELQLIENYRDLFGRVRVAVLELHHHCCDVERCARLLREAGLVHHRRVWMENTCSIDNFWRDR